jgi:hypothetical protein
MVTPAAFDIPILKQAKAEYTKLLWKRSGREDSYPQIYPQGTVPTVLLSDLNLAGTPHAASAGLSQAVEKPQPTG